MTLPSRRLAPLAVAGVLCIAALALAGRATVAAPFDAFAAQNPGQRLLFGLRVGVLLAATWACAERRAYRTLAGVAVAFVASLAARSLVFVLVGAGLFALVDAGWIAPAVLAASLLPWTLLSPAPRERELPTQPAALVAHYRAAGNLWRARYAALGWAREEGRTPGAGMLTLAEIDWALGQKGELTRVLGALRAHARDPAIRARADELARRWHLESKAR